MTGNVVSKKIGRQKLFFVSYHKPNVNISFDEVINEYSKLKSRIPSDIKKIHKLFKKNKKKLFVVGGKRDHNIRKESKRF